MIDGVGEGKVKAWPGLGCICIYICICIRLCVCLCLLLSALLIVMLMSLFSELCSLVLPCLGSSCACSYLLFAVSRLCTLIHMIILTMLMGMWPPFLHEEEREPSMAVGCVSRIPCRSWCYMDAGWYHHGVSLIMVFRR